MGNWVGGGSSSSSSNSISSSSSSASSPNGQFHYVSSGVSSFNDGQDNSGTHMYNNVNGNIQHTTTGNMPQGFFSQNFPFATVTSVILIVVLSAAVMLAIVAIFTSIVSKGNKKKQKELLKKSRALASGNFQLIDEPFPHQYKRPFADAMWNSDLSLEEQLVEVDLEL